MAASVAVPVAPKYERLATRLIIIAFFNLFLVSCLGLLLRAFPFVHISLDFKNVLHGHSHFAFGGWVMPMLVALILKLFPQVAQRVVYKHWRNLAALLLASAYGMLVAFPLQGYKAVSIFFSTVSVAAGYYLIVVLWKALDQTAATLSTRFLKAGLFYLGLSAVGPFATGPLIALGYQGTPLYFDAIYFYLHFQYNGWFLFTVLALLYKTIENSAKVRHGSTVFHLFNLACLPAYALSLLWNGPHVVFNIIGGAAALLQVLALFYLLRDLPLAQWTRNSRLYVFAIGALVLKVVLQVASAFPAVAVLGYTYRNFIIAYLHLVLLGCISMFLFAFVCSSYPKVRTPLFKSGFRLFLLSFLTTETLLAVQAGSAMLGVTLPHAALWLFLFSLFFPAGMLAMSMGVLKSLADTNIKASWRKAVSIA
jgi:hypothetical protein